jgi:hypothetical protein
MFFSRCEVKFCRLSADGAHHNSEMICLAVHGLKVEEIEKSCFYSSEYIKSDFYYQLK